MNNSEIQFNSHPILSRLASWVLVLSLVGYPIAGCTSLFLEIPNRFVSIPYRILVLAASLIILITYWGKIRMSGSKREQVDGLQHPKFWICFWVFWGLYLIRIGIDSVFYDKAMRMSTWEFYAYAVGMSLIPAVSLSLRNVPCIQPNTVYLIILFGMIGLLATLALYNFQGGYSDFAYLTQNRIEIETINPILIGRLSATIITLSLWMLLSVRGGSRVFVRILLLGCIALSVVGLIAAASRGPTLSLLIILPLIFFSVGLRGKKIVAITFLCFLALGFIYFLSGIDFNDFYLTTRVNSTSFEEDDMRARLLSDGVDIVLANPLFGGGVEPLEFYPHNLILESFLVFGMVTGICFLYIQLYSIWVASKLMVVTSPNCWIVFLLVQYSVNALVSGSLDSSSDLWMMMLVGVSELTRQSQFVGEIHGVQSGEIIGNITRVR